ncbi:endoplasmic reticulum protein [Cryptococcus gattii E566]|uniref:Endoplasmic reticulum transmembrane protein n=2 Tax=Cryptococcus gattii TaxID=37769 RepID=E6R4K1_CRYGW|nr:Endoplasmic reticulum protein, putative [Cryptococcus gattii WM276]ADV22056.1 Endoplasmic reticulum protein, putative [Cryptococcus gattii WM276]KIR80409.1 endoplasmic reticulum protein [Cryptococcus gattii EJB2]KIY33453.1 endoplasmic reticulum protein [Cryptococcus gattii E566]KJE00410.1 endoplasmic reticulum protein [Cryptococcus gattii NT-10]
MTLYYSICFGLLMAELSLFCTIVCPMPFAIRKKMFHFLSENPVVAKIQYGLKITFIFVAVLFVDALQRMIRIAQEGATAKMKQDMADARTETNYAARRFYAQRNLYLTGATLFLSLLLARVFYIILDFIQVQESYTALQAKTAKASGAAGENEELRNRIAELEAKERDFETLKKQASQQNAEYGRLADEHNKATGVVSDKKSD